MEGWPGPFLNVCKSELHRLLNTPSTRGIPATLWWKARSGAIGKKPGSGRGKAVLWALRDPESKAARGPEGAWP